MANKDFKVKNGLDIQTPLPVSMGGTGQTSTTNTLNALLPAQAGNTNKVLSTDGTNTSWVAQATAYQRGTTAQRPQAPAIGDLYYNTELNYFESYTSNGWFPIAAAPLAPTGVTATNQGTGRAFNNGQMSVAFSPNTSGGAPSSFIVTPSPSTSPSTFTASSSPVTITGLASSTQYTYTVQATSPYGNSSASAASSAVTATTVPQAPTIGTATVLSTTSVSVEFTPGATGGSAITSYTVTSSPGGVTATGSSSPITVSNLVMGTAYTFTVTATNANGTSLPSASSNSATPSEQQIPLLGTWIQGASHPAGTGPASHWGITIVNSESRLLAMDNPRVATLRYNDGKGGSWTTGATRPEGQGLSTSSKYYTSDNRMYTVGGDTGDPDNVYATNAAGSSWSTFNQAPISASWGNGAYFNGHLYTINNLGYSPAHASARTTTNDNTSWGSYAATPEYRYGSSAAPMHDKLIYWGGFASGWTGSASVYATTGNGSWTVETNAPHTGNTFMPHGFATNGTFSRVYTMSGTNIWSRTHNSGTWVQENSLPGGRSAQVIHMVQNGTELWVQAVASDNTVWYQRLI